MLEELYKHAKTMEPKNLSEEGIRQHYFSHGFGEGEKTEKIKFRHPKSDPPKDFQRVFVWPQMEACEYQRGLFMIQRNGYSAIILGVELWFQWGELTDLFEYPKDHEIGKVK